MTAAAAIQIVSSGNSQLGLGRGFAAHGASAKSGASVSGVWPADSSAGASAGAESFRSGLQSLLVALGAGSKDVDAEESESSGAGAAAETASVLVHASIPASASVSLSNALLAASAGVSLRQKAAAGSEQTGASTEKAATSARTGTSTLSPPREKSEQSSSKNTASQTGRADAVAVVANSLPLTMPSPGPVINPTAQASVTVSNTPIRQFNGPETPSNLARPSDLGSEVGMTGKIGDSASAKTESLPAQQSADPEQSSSLERSSNLEKSSNLPTGPTDQQTIERPVQQTAGLVAETKAPTVSIPSIDASRSALQSADAVVGKETAASSRTESPLASGKELARAKELSSATEGASNVASTRTTAEKPTPLVSGQSPVQDQPSTRVSAVRAAATVAPAEIAKATGNPDGLLTAVDASSSSTDEASAILSIQDQPIQGQSIQGQSSLASGSRGAGSTARVSSSTHATQHKSLEGQSVGQPLSMMVDPAGVTRELAGLQNPTRSTYSETAGTSTGSASKEGIGEPFAALDAAGASTSTTWTHAGAHQAEAGYQDPVLGWISVRAESSGGGIHAALVPGSEEAGQALGGHLAGLNAYLAEHHTEVGTVTVAAPEHQSAGAAMEQGSNQGMNQGAGQQTAHERQTGASSGPSGISGSSGRSLVQSTAQTSALSSASAGPGLTVQTVGSSGGVHISVMA